MKKLIWLIGKPGSGKTTIGSSLAEASHIKYFSYGELLKEVQPNPGERGYSLVDRDNVNQILINESKNYKIVIVDGNPYSQVGFGFLDQMQKYFKTIKTIELYISDETAVDRLERRNRTILVHDGVTQKDRIDYFAESLAPLIHKNRDKYSITKINVDNLNLKESISLIQAYIK